MNWYWYLAIYFGLLLVLFILIKDRNVEFEDVHPYWVRRLLLVLTSIIGLTIYILNMWFSVFIYTPFKQFYETWFKKNW